jgi:cell division septation protein DedD
MPNDREGEGDVREFRLEGATLVVAVAALVLVLGGTFMLGRWVERRSSAGTERGALPAEDPLTQVTTTEEPADVDAGADYFDRADEGDQQLEPQREARTAAPEESTPAAGRASSAPAATASAGDFYVQVWAGRDREAAELLVDKLQKEGYPVRLFSDRAEGDTLFKVRVGGYPSESDARRMSGELEQKGYRGAWVTSVR